MPAGTGIVVCRRGEYRGPARDAVRLPTGRGRRSIRLGGGMVEWRLAGMPVDAGDPA